MNTATAASWYMDGVRSGGPIAILILLVGIGGLAVMAERVYVIVIRSKNNGRMFIERIIQLVRGGKIDEAIKQCAASTAALPDMGLIMLRSRSKDEINLQQLAGAAALTIIPRLTHRLHYLRTFALVAVMLGVLGTLHGISAALLAAGAGSNANLFTALGEALRPTALGLVVAMVLQIGRGYLAVQAEAITGEIHEFSARLINALIDRPDVRLGHR
ncbi:MAG: MotA/TolQ/ExbB proton channel family protein [Gemmatimonadaceae bacterium]